MGRDECVLGAFLFDSPPPCRKARGLRGGARLRHLSGESTAIGRLRPPSLNSEKLDGLSSDAACLGTESASLTTLSRAIETVIVLVYRLPYFLSAGVVTSLCFNTHFPILIGTGQKTKDSNERPSGSLNGGWDLYS